MKAEGLAISVESHSENYGETLEEARLPYRVVRSSRRWVYLTDYLPSPVAEATARFLQRTIFPEMLLDHLDTAFGDISEEDRLAVFQDGVTHLSKDEVTCGTRELLQPSLEETRGISIEGWLRFRGRAVLGDVIVRLALEGIKSLRLERALDQFRSLDEMDLHHLMLEGRGNNLVIRDDRGREVFREFLDGYLDPSVKIGREDLAAGILRILQPEKVDMKGVTPTFRRRVHKLLGL